MWWYWAGNCQKSINEESKRKISFHLFHSILFVVAVVAFFIIKMVNKTRTERLPTEFRAAITGANSSMVPLSPHL